MNVDIGGIDDGMFVDTIKSVFTFKAHLFGMDFVQGQMVLYSLVITFGCIVIMIFEYAKTYKRK